MVTKIISIHRYHGHIYELNASYVNCKGSTNNVFYLHSILASITRRYWNAILSKTSSHSTDIAYVDAGQFGDHFYYLKEKTNNMTKQYKFGDIFDYNSIFYFIIIWLNKINL